MKYKVQKSLMIPEGWTAVAVSTLVLAGWLHLETPRTLVDILLMSTLVVAPIGALCAIAGVVMTTMHWHRDRTERWFLLGHGLMGGLCVLACLFWLKWKGITLM